MLDLVFAEFFQHEESSYFMGAWCLWTRVIGFVHSSFISAREIAAWKKYAESWKLSVSNFI
jgi:hypothetical protein